MKKLAISLLVILSGCTAVPSVQQRCPSYEDCPHLVGSLKPTKARIEKAREKGWPIPVHTTPPIYPKEALAKRIEGYVVVQYDVTRSGDSVNISIFQASPEGVFEKSAAQTVKYFKYEKSNKEYKGIKTKVSYYID